MADRTYFVKSTTVCYDAEANNCVLNIASEKEKELQNVMNAILSYCFLNAGSLHSHKSTEMHVGYFRILYMTYQRQVSIQPVSTCWSRGVLECIF